MRYCVRYCVVLCGTVGEGAAHHLQGAYFRCGASYAFVGLFGFLCCSVYCVAVKRHALWQRRYGGELHTSKVSGHGVAAPVGLWC